MKKIIPDLVTLLNLVCGVCACILALWGEYYPAFIFIIGAACFDFLDGFCARLMGAPSELGKQLDSLCDLVSFGLAPALMAFNWMMHSPAKVPALAYFSFVFVCCAALRLARFNIDNSQLHDFKGLAVPAAAMVMAPMLAYGQVCDARGFDSLLLPLLNSCWFLPVVTVVLGLLMVSRIPMFSLKGKRLSFKDYPRESVHFLSVFLLASPLAVIKGALLKVHFVYATLPLLILFSMILYILVNLVALGTKKTTPEQSL